MFARHVIFIPMIHDSLVPSIYQDQFNFAWGDSICALTLLLTFPLIWGGETAQMFCHQFFLDDSTD